MPLGFVLGFARALVPVTGAGQTTALAVHTTSVTGSPTGKHGRPQKKPQVFIATADMIIKRKETGALYSSPLLFNKKGGRFGRLFYRHYGLTATDRFQYIFIRNGANP
jgi:hypothetical protein